MSFFQANDLPDILASLKLRLLKVRLDPTTWRGRGGDRNRHCPAPLPPAESCRSSPHRFKTLLSILEKAGTDALTSDVEMSLTRIRFFLTQLSV